MRTVDDFGRIRQAHRDGLSSRQIAKQFGVGRDTVRKALQNAEPAPYSRSEPRSAPVFGPFRPFVDAMLAADETAPRKQRHTARQVYRRLVAEHGYRGKYDQVRRYLQQRRHGNRETFIPLEHRPGVRAEADFGHIYVDFPEGRRQTPVLIVTWSYSNAPFAIALPTERTEAILHGLVGAFAFFGAVPSELWWDNPKTVAIHLFRGRERTLHPRYAALASHYPFTPKFCLAATPTEKPRVEKRVFDLERQWATPVPRVADLAELNAHLRSCCLSARDRTCGDNTATVGARFEQDKAAALPVPTRDFDACVIQPGAVDKYQTVRFDGNHYSVPRRWAFRAVTVKGYVDRVAIVADGQVVAVHARSYGRREKVLDPLHFLVVLERKPAALDHAPVYRDWQLPTSFAELRRELEGRLGTRAGVRQFIRVLQLFSRHSVARVERAIELCRAHGSPDAAAIAAAVERSSERSECDTPMSLKASSVAAIAANVQMPLPDLSQFDRLLDRRPSTPYLGDDHEPERCARDVGESQPQATQAADHAGRVGEAGS
jgi:transposase